VGGRADESKPTRTRRAATSVISKTLVEPTLVEPTPVEPTPVEPTQAKPTPTMEPAAPKATTTKATVTKAAKHTTMLPEPGTPLPNSLVKRVARSYTPSGKAQALEHAAAHGVSAAWDKFEISRFSIYDWQRKLKNAAAGEGPSPTSGPSPQTIEEQRDQEILIDDCARFVTGHGVDDAERADLVIHTFEEVVARHGKPERVMHDHGAAFWSWCGISRFTALLTELDIDQVVAEHKKHNGKVEVFNANLHKEHRMSGCAGLAGDEAAFIRFIERTPAGLGLGSKAWRERLTLTGSNCLVRAMFQRALDEMPRWTAPRGELRALRVDLRWLHERLQLWSVAELPVLHP
jgi:transposase InsO family protein